MRFSHTRMLRLAECGDERAREFLMAFAKKSPKRRGRKSIVNTKDALITARGPNCEVCAGVLPSTSLLHAHHIIPVASGGTDEETNLVLVCPNCHAIAHWGYRETTRLPQNADEFFAFMKIALVQKAAA